LKNPDKYVTDSERIDYIPLVLCKHGYLYEIHSRNLSHGVFNGADRGFIGIRTKFGSRFLFTEYHYDTGAPHGTAKPFMEMGKVPEGIQISDHLRHAKGSLWAVNPKSGQLEEVFREDLRAEQMPHGRHQGFVDTWVNSRERLPEDLYPSNRTNDALFSILNVTL
jgi:hypothetical protein